MKIVSIHCQRGAVEGFVRVLSRFILHCAFRSPGSEPQTPQGDHTETQLPYITPSDSGHTAYYDNFSLTIETPHHQHGRRDP